MTKTPDWKLLFSIGREIDKTAKLPGEEHTIASRMLADAGFEMDKALWGKVEWAWMKVANDRVEEARKGSHSLAGYIAC